VKPKKRSKPTSGGEREKPPSGDTPGKFLKIQPIEEKRRAVVRKCKTRSED